MGKIIALARKDIKLLLRDKSGSFFVLFFPLLMATFFGVVFSGGGGETSAIPVVVVDEDSTTQSIAFAEVLNQADELEVVFHNRAEAEKLVRQGKKSAYILLPEGFGARKENMFGGDPPILELGVDPSRKAEAAMLRGVLTGHFMQGMMQDFTDPGKMRGQIQDGLTYFRSLSGEEREKNSDFERFLVSLDTAMADLQTVEADSAGGESGRGDWQPLQFEKRDVAIERAGPKNAFEITFPQALIWAMIGCAASFGISLVVERTRGTLIRLRTAPLSLSQILAGKGIACLVSIITVSFLLLIIGMGVFNVRPHSISYLAMAVVSSAICFVGIMMLLSVLGKTEASAGGIGWAALLVMSMTGGGMIPVIVMPKWVAAIGNFSPVKWSILAMEGAVWRGFSPSEMFYHCAILCGAGIIFFIVGSRIFKHTVN